jgi:hypothetical protein
MTVVAMHSTNGDLMNFGEVREHVFRRPARNAFGKMRVLVYAMVAIALAVVFLAMNPIPQSKADGAIWWYLEGPAQEDINDANLDQLRLEDACRRADGQVIQSVVGHTHDHFGGWLVEGVGWVRVQARLGSRYVRCKSRNVLL